MQQLRFPRTAAVLEAATLDMAYNCSVCGLVQCADRTRCAVCGVRKHTVVVGRVRVAALSSQMLLDPLEIPYNRSINWLSSAKVRELLTGQNADLVARSLLDLTGVMREKASLLRGYPKVGARMAETICRIEAILKECSNAAL